MIMIIETLFQFAGRLACLFERMGWVGFGWIGLERDGTGWDGMVRGLKGGKKTLMNV